MRCGWCDGRAYAEYVDVGVGAVQVDAGRCGDCGAQQMNPYYGRDGASPEETQRGWWRGEATDDFMIRLVKTNEWLTGPQWWRRMAGYFPHDPEGYGEGLRVNMQRIFHWDHAIVHDCVVEAVWSVVLDRYYKRFVSRCGLIFTFGGAGPQPAPTCFKCLLATQPNTGAS